MLLCYFVLVSITHELRDVVCYKIVKIVHINFRLKFCIKTQNIKKHKTDVRTPCSLETIFEKDIEKEHMIGLLRCPSIIVSIMDRIRTLVGK